MQPSKLSWILDPVPPSEFFKIYFESFPLLVSRNDPYFYDKYINAESISAFLFSTQNSPFLNLKLSHPTAAISESDYLSFSKSENTRIKTGIKLSNVSKIFHQKKATLSVDNLNRFMSWCKELSQQIDTLLNSTSRCVLKITPASSSPFKPSYEVYDQFIMQISGHLTFRVFSCPIENPLSFQAARAFDLHNLDVLLEGVLAPGDLLYVPRGFVFEACASEEAVSQMYLNVYNTSWTKVLSDTITSYSGEIKSMREGYALTDLKSKAEKENTFENIKSGILARIRGQKFVHPASGYTDNDTMRLASEMSKVVGFNQ